MSTKKVELTQEAYDRLLEQKEQLKKAMEDAWKRAGEAAGKTGDWHENAPYEQAKLDHERYFNQLQEIKERLSRVKIMEKNTTRGKITLGAEVVLSINGNEATYMLEDSSISKPGMTTISPDSPIGKKVLGEKVGAKFTIETPQGENSVEIIEIG